MGWEGKSQCKKWEVGLGNHCGEREERGHNELEKLLLILILIGNGSSTCKLYFIGLTHQYMLFKEVKLG